MTPPTTRRLLADRPSGRRLGLAGAFALTMLALVGGIVTWRGDAPVIIQAARDLEVARDLARRAEGPVPVPVRLVNSFCTEDASGSTIVYAFEPNLPFLGGREVFIAAGPIPWQGCAGDCSYAVAETDATVFARVRAAGLAGSPCPP